MIMLRHSLSLFFLSLTFLRADDPAISDGSRTYLDLAGQWDVLPISGLKLDFPPASSGWKQEPVPSDSSPSLPSPTGPYGANVPEYLNADKSGFLRQTGMAAWFRRDFTVPKELPAGRRALLCFHGMSFKSEVWLNGKKIGGSLFGQVPVTYDVTDTIHPGASNELVVGLTGREGVIDLVNQTFIAPTNGAQAGIWGKVELQFVPETRIDDVFVKTSVKNKQLALDVTLLNAGSQSENFSVGALITDVKQNPETQLDPIEVTVAPGETKVVTLTKNWIAPELWSPTDPTLYFARVSLGKNNEEVDTKSVRFGFREFEIRGRDFYLNGQKIVLLRASFLNEISKTRGGVFREFRDQAAHPYNAIRLHIGFDSPATLDLCDEMGILAMPESAWFTLDVKFRLEKRALWIPTAQEYLKALIKLNRNRPSIVMWNLTNESIWENTTPAHMEVADAMVSVAKAEDPTRPFEGDGESYWGGRLPVINIHYPESSVGNSLRAQYPNSGFVYPNDFYWLVKDKENTSWVAKFTWDRPLMIGEYFYPSGDPDKLSAFMGDSIYDWEKWKFQRLDGRDVGPIDRDEYVETQQGLADAYRIQGVAGLNPWGSNGNRVIPQIAVRPVDFFPNAFSGSTVTRKFVVFNDSGQGFDDLNLQCRLTVKGETVWEQDFPANASSGEPAIIEVPIQCPSVDHPVKAELSVRLRFHMAPTWQQLDRAVVPLFIMPAPRLADIDAKTVFLFDQTSRTANALSALGLNVNAATTLAAGDLQGKKTLIIGEDSDASPYKEVVSDFAKSGGSVIVLRQSQWTPLAPELPEIDKQHVSTRSWRRTFDHPITRDLDDRQLSYWRPDALVSLKTFRKPAAGRYRILLDSGGLFGMRWSPLLEVPLGQGTFILTSLDLVGRVKVEPVAAQLLANMVRYAGTFQPTPDAPLRLLAGTNAPLRATLTAANVIFQEGMTGTGPILLDASFAPSADQLAQMKSFLAQGGHLWLHGFSRDSIGKVAELFPFPPELEDLDPKSQEAALRSDDPQLDNLASFDFFWTRMDLETNEDFVGQPTAKLGTVTLKLPTLQSGTRLVDPGVLVKIPSGRGTLLFDTLAWEGALGAETEKVTRIVSALAQNQGAKVRTTSDETLYDYFPVDISGQANMGYYDPVADDGKGGWTDQGTNDMRFFLINHVGKTGGLETGAVVEAEQFPSEVTMAGRKFWLLDPRKTADHAVISLRGGEHGAKLPGSANGIPVHRKADALWFLDAAGWAPPDPSQEVARYVIHYADGTQNIFSVRYNQEISEWWNPKPISGARIAWTGNNLVASPIGIYSTEWKNPYPDREISTIDLVGNLSITQVVVLAITGGAAPAGTKKTTLYGDWKFNNFVGGKVPNSVSGGGDLVASAPAPVPVANHGLRFVHGAQLSGDLKKIPGLGGMGEGKPFAVKITFTPEAKPSGYFGGLFQAMDYGRAGFRLELDQQMKAVVEIFLNGSPDGRRGLESRAPLEFGRTYTVEVRFDGTYATLLIDGKVDQMQEMTLPGVYNGEFDIGVAGGTHYFFNGTIEDLSLMGLASN
jgi:hypothetical protein